ncbi:MAG: hypothetical protein ACRD3B_03210 [Candidatus Sulfotelmatobacter sp.]
MTLLLLTAVGSAFADVESDNYSVSCASLWPAVKDTVRNSGFYAIVLIDNTEMAASYDIGVGQGPRIESVVLNVKGDNCEMQVQPLYQPTFANDGEISRNASMARWPN